MGIFDAVGFCADGVGKCCDLGVVVVCWRGPRTGGGNLGACHHGHDKVMPGGRTLASAEREIPQIRLRISISAEYFVAIKINDTFIDVKCDGTAHVR